MEKKINTLINLLADKEIINKEKLNKNETISEKLDFAINYIKDSQKNKYMHQFAVLYEISNIIKSYELNRNIFNNILKLIKDIINYDYGSIFFYKKENKELELIEYIGKPVNMADDFKLGEGIGLTGWLAKKKKSLYLSNLKKTGDRDFSSFISIPLIVNDSLEGMLNLAKKEKNGFDDSSQSLLHIISSEIGLNIERMKYINEIENKNKRLQEMLDQINKNRDKLLKAERLMAVSEMIVGINHKINNLLSLQSGSIFLLKKKLKENNLYENYESYIDEIQKAYSKIKNVVKNLDELKSKYQIKDYLDDINMVDLSFDTEKEEDKNED